MAAYQQKFKKDWLVKVALEWPFTKLNLSVIKFKSVTTTQKLK